VRQILLIDDPSGMTVSTSEGTRDARPGEVTRFDVLAEELSRQTGLPAEVRTDPTEAVDPETAVVVSVSQLHLLPAGSAARAVVVDVPRHDILSMFTVHGVAAVVEYQQYWKWRTGGPADASIFGDLSVVPRLGREVTVKPLDDDRFGRIRITGEDLPGLIAGYLTSR
jgi:hypothetical protein